MSLATYTYEVDAENRFLSVSEAWCEFAENNGATRIADRSAVVGRSLWAFIAGQEARHLYALIFQKVRAEQRQALVPFRCDSPTIRRFMQLAIEPLADGALRLTSCLLKEEEREYMPLLDAGTSRSDEHLTICSWCKRVEVPTGEWLEVEEAVTRLDLFRSTELPHLSHGVCHACAQPWTG